jgi:hypothetical protein
MNGQESDAVEAGPSVTLPFQLSQQLFVLGVVVGSDCELFLFSLFKTRFAKQEYVSGRRFFASSYGFFVETANSQHRSSIVPSISPSLLNHGLPVPGKECGRPGGEQIASTERQILRRDLLLQ